LASALGVVFSIRIFNISLVRIVLPKGRDIR